MSEEQATYQAGTPTTECTCRVFDGHLMERCPEAERLFAALVEQIFNKGYDYAVWADRHITGDPDPDNHDEEIAEARRDYEVHIIAATERCARERQVELFP